MIQSAITISGGGPSLSIVQASAPSWATAVSIPQLVKALTRIAVVIRSSSAMSARMTGVRQVRCLRPFCNAVQQTDTRACMLCADPPDTCGSCTGDYVSAQRRGREPFSNPISFPQGVGKGFRCDQHVAV